MSLSFYGTITLHGFRSKNNKLVNKSVIQKHIMASEQIMSEAITAAVAEVIRIALHTMVEAQAERMHDGSGPKLGGPAVKQPTFDWNVQDKYSELKAFQLEVNNILSTYSTPQMDKLALVKNWFL